MNNDTAFLMPTGKQRLRQTVSLYFHLPGINVRDMGVDDRATYTALDGG